MIPRQYRAPPPLPLAPSVPAPQELMIQDCTRSIRAGLTASLRELADRGAGAGGWGVMGKERDEG